MDKPEKVEPGQIWADNDIRATHQEFTIVAVGEDGYATAKRGPRSTTIAVHRLLRLNGQRGYTYLGMSK